MAMETNNIRIIVPCHDSDLTIERCISSVFWSENIDFEVVIVDDGNNSKISSLTDRYPVKVITTTGSEGAGRARNSGTLGFRGRFLVFIDSDVQVYPDTVKSLVEPIEENKAEATVGSYSRVHCKSFCQTYKHLYLAYRYGTKQKYLTNTFWSAICAVDYKVFTEASGFKESFQGAGPEDIDLGMELSGRGARILSVPEARGIHLAGLSFIGLIENDLRKGTEDIYIHWTRKIPLSYNRHVTGTDVFSVLLACSIPVLLVLKYFIGIWPLLACILLYMIARVKLIINAFDGQDLLFITRAVILTWLLDLIRGIAVLKGTLLYILEILSSGKYKPFVKASF